MRPWAPFELGDWPETVEILTASGRSWPEGCAVFDLRWHVDQRVPLPGRRKLTTRWRWSERRVRDLLRDTARWWDPKKGDAPTSRDDHDQRPEGVIPPCSHPAPTAIPPSSHSTTDVPEQLAASDPSPIPVRSQSDPTSGHTRGEGIHTTHVTLTEHPAPESEVEKTRANAGDSVVFARAKDKPIRKTPEEAWQVQRCVALAGMSIVSGMSTMPPEVTERIVAAVRSGWTDADFDLVWQWSANSGDRMAELARESIGAARWSWLLAKQRENRRTEAKAWDARGRVDTPSAARSPPRGDAAGKVSVMSVLFDNTGDTDGYPR